MHTSLYGQRIPINPAQMRRLVAQLLDAEDGFVLVVTEPFCGCVAGFLLALAYADPISDERIATELAWYVDPGARGIGLRMLRRAEAWARLHGVVRLQLAAPSPETERLYERLGYRALERTYDRRL